MRKNIALILPLLAAVISALAFASLNSALAQGMTSDGGNMSVGTNMTNMTMGRNATGVGNMSNTSTAMSDGAMMANSS